MIKLNLHWSLYFNNLKQVRSYVMKTAHRIKKDFNYTFSQSLKIAWSFVKELSAKKYSYVKYIVKVYNQGEIEFIGFKDIMSLYLNLKEKFLNLIDENKLPSYYRRESITKIMDGEDDKKTMIFEQLPFVYKILNNKEFKFTDELYCELIKIN